MRLKELFTVPEGQKVTERHLRRVLTSSILSILLCMSCLVSSTWAWFTVSIENTNNIITIGTPKCTVTLNNSVVADSAELTVGTHTLKLEQEPPKADDLNQQSPLYILITITPLSSTSGESSSGTTSEQTGTTNPGGESTLNPTIDPDSTQTESQDQPQDSEETPAEPDVSSTEPEETKWCVVLNSDNGYKEEITIQISYVATLSWTATWENPEAGISPVTDDTITLGTSEDSTGDSTTGDDPTIGEDDTISGDDTSTDDDTIGDNTTGDDTTGDNTATDDDTTGDTTTGDDTTGDDSSNDNTASEDETGSEEQNGSESQNGTESEETTEP